MPMHKFSSEVWQVYLCFALLSVGRDLKFANNILSRRKEQEEEEVRGSEEEEEEIEIADGQR